MSRWNRARGWIGRLALAAALAAPVPGMKGADVPESTVARFRIAVSLRTVGEQVNENDARIALRVWANAVSRQSGMAIEYPPGVVSSSEDLWRLIRHKALDGFGIMTEEYKEVAAYVDRSDILVDDVWLGGGEQYVVLVHSASGLKRVEDLRGRSLLVENTTRAGLAMPWLETVLAAANLPRASRYFIRMSGDSKPSRVVLPVFFRQSDACLVTSRTFAVMCELNPQLGRQMRPLLTSPQLVTSFMAFHRDCPPARKDRLIWALTHLQETAYGRQALTFFQVRRLVVANGSVVDRSLELLDAHQRLQTKGAGATR